jgi:hypothetical protein
MLWIRNTAKNCGRPRPSHGVDNRLRLLKDLLVHEAGEVALHDLLDLQHDGGDLPALGRLQVNAPADPAATSSCVLKNLGFNKKIYRGTSVRFLVFVEKEYLMLIIILNR